jgi:hypothetical protein
LTTQIYKPEYFTTSTVRAAQGAEELVQELISKRLKAGQARMVQEASSFHILVLLALHLIMEQLMFLLFGLSCVYVDMFREGSKQQQKRIVLCDTGSA